jgi:hypothetical protein
MPDAEVKTRLVIEQDGDPQVFRDAAAAIGDLAAALQSLQSAGGASFAPLLAQLDQVITKANEAAAAVAQVAGQ